MTVRRNVHNCFMDSWPGVCIKVCSRAGGVGSRTVVGLARFRRGGGSNELPLQAVAEFPCGSLADGPSAPVRPPRSRLGSECWVSSGGAALLGATGGIGGL